MAMLDPVRGFIENTEEVGALIALHEKHTGTDAGRRFGVEILNKSGVVLLTACWEAFVEDAASTAFEYILKHSTDPKKLPDSVLKRVAKAVRDDKHDLKPWELAGDGWRRVLADYKDKMLHTHVSFFNTPKAGNIDALFDELLGLPNISNKWTWNRMSAQKARDRLAEYVELRGSIAHRVKASKSVRKQTVKDYGDFIGRLAERTANVTNEHVKFLVGSYPWPMFVFSPAL
jgi:hypothetical protein